MWLTATHQPAPITAMRAFLAMPPLRSRPDRVAEYGGALDRRPVHPNAETRPFGHAHEAVAVGPDHVEGAVLEGGIGGGLLEPAAVGVGLHEVQVRGLGQRVAPAQELAAR